MAKYAIDMDHPTTLYKKDGVDHFFFSKKDKVWKEADYDIEKLFNGMTDSKILSDAEVQKWTGGIL